MSITKLVSVRVRGTGTVLTLLLLAQASRAEGLSAQTITGKLTDGNTNRPILYGRVVLRAESGDSVGVFLTNGTGNFVVTAPRPGAYFLTASAIGYRETTAGTFELAPDSSVTLQFPIQPVPLRLDEIVVTMPFRISEPKLIRNGFLQRLQTGFGHFITPGDLDKAPGRTLTDLLWGIPRVHLEWDPCEGGTDLCGGFRVTMSAPLGECGPPIWIDGMLVSTSGRGLDMLAPLHIVDAVEIYRGASETPLQWSGTMSQGCGAIVIWTK